MVAEDLGMDKRITRVVSKWKRFELRFLVEHPVLLIWLLDFLLPGI
jgi:hypothetical protein